MRARATLATFSEVLFHEPRLIVWSDVADEIGPMFGSEVFRRGHRRVEVLVKTAARRPVLSVIP
jgi:hypothetical protein